MLKDIMKLKKDGKEIGMTFSCFDLLHAGHNAMLSEAKAECDILVVGLQTDPTIDRPEKNPPVQSVFERWMQLQAIRDVDFIVPYATEQELIDILLTIQPHYRIIGDEYKDKEFSGKDVEGIINVYNGRAHSFSTTSLRQRVALKEKG